MTKDSRHHTSVFGLVHAVLICYHNRMSLPYGRYPKKSPKRRSALSQSHGRIRAALGKADSLEEFSLLLQMLVARLQDMNVHGLGGCTVYFEPLDAHGTRMGLSDDCGVPVQALTVPSNNSSGVRAGDDSAN